MVAGGARTPGHVNGTARAGIASATTDDDGDFSIDVEPLPTDDEGIYPPQAYYLVTFGGGRFKAYQVKVKPTEDGTYVITDPDVVGETEDLLPPEFVQVVPEIDDAAVVAYFTDNPIDVTDEVATVFAATPPLFAANNLDDVDDAATARLNIGAASDTDVAALINALAERISTLEQLEALNPAVRTDDLTGAIVQAPNHDSVTVDFPGGVPTFTTDP